MAYKYLHIRYNLSLQVGCHHLNTLRLHSTWQPSIITIENLLLQLKRYEACCCLFKELGCHELKYRFSLDQQNYLFMINAILGLKATELVLQRLTQSQLMTIVLAPLRFGSIAAFEDKEVCRSCPLRESISLPFMLIFKPAIICLPNRSSTL